MKINNSKDVALWENIPCSCNHDSVMTEFPVKNCIHCKCMQAWESVPQEDFKINTFDEDRKNKR